MKIITIMCLLLSTSVYAQIECKGYSRLYQNNQMEEKEVTLELTADNARFLKMQGALDDVFFGVTQDKPSDSFLVTVTNADDYTRGVVTRASFDLNGRLHVSSVKGELVHKLECRRD